VPEHFIQRSSPDFWRASLALSIGAFVTFANLYSTQALLPLFAREFGISPASASLSLSVSTAALALALLITPMLSDHAGRKSVMLTSLILTALSGFAIAASQHYLWLLLFRAIQGFSLAGLAAIAMTYVGEEFAANCRGLAMGLYVSGTAIGGMMGRIVTGTLTELFSWSAALLILAIISSLCTLIFAIALPPSRHFARRSASLTEMRQGFSFHLQRPDQLGRFMHGFLLMGGLVTLYNYLGFRLHQPPYLLSDGQIGWLFSIYLTGIFSSTWLGSQSDKYGARNILLICLALMLSGTLLSLASSLNLIILAMALYTFGFFGAHSVVSSWCGQQAQSFKAQASALYLLFYYVGSSILGASGGYIWSQWQWPGVVTMVLILVSCSTLITWNNKQ